MSQRMFVLDLPVSKCEDCNKEKVCKYKDSYKKNIVDDKDNSMRKLIQSNDNITITIKCKYFEDKISALRKG